MKSKVLWAVTAMLALATLPLLGAQDASADEDPRGFLYGRVTTESGTDYEGFLRWGTEEAFWDDLFHSSKEDLPFLDEFDSGDRDRRDRNRHRAKILGLTINWESDGKHWGGSSSRIFISRFGDIAEIEVTGGDDAELLMKSGEQFEVSGYANDVGGTVHVSDESLGDIDLHWDRIERIVFESAPGGKDPGAFRLYGTVETRSGEYEGFIQWDKQECLSTDLLDGDTSDGDISIKMGRIRSIERRGHRGSDVELKDGRTMRLRGSNDVNDENRGVMVEDERYGRLTIPWDEFDRVTFADGKGSGRGYGDFPDGKKLMGKVTDVDGDSYEGRLVFDLDESEDWEILNGSFDDIEFDIPFRNITSIEPRRHDESLIVLRGGEQIRLEDSQDVSDDNDGILIFTRDDDDPVHIHWDDVERIELRH